MKRLFENPIADTKQVQPEPKKFKENFEYPKIIHFIWAGGSKGMPEKQTNTVKAWLEKNSDFQVYFWIDGRTFKTHNLPTYYNKMFAPYEIHYDENAKIRLMNIEDVLSQALELKQCVYYEIDRLEPNYGASSDLLRYQILYIYGGAYFDADVRPGNDLLNKVFSKTPTYHVMYVDHLSQESNDKIAKQEETKNKKLKNFQLEENRSLGIAIGNDTFICTTNNPIMLKILNTAIANYQNLSDSKQIQATYCAFNIEMVTIERTGPVCVRNVLETWNATKETSANTPYLKLNQEGSLPIELWPVRSPDYNLTDPFDMNQQTWLNQPITICDINEACNKIKSTIEFEAKFFKILRLEDHLEHLSKMPDFGEIAENILFEEIKELNLSNIEVIQFTTHAKAIEFYQKNITSADEKFKIKQSTEAVLENMLSIPSLTLLKQKRLTVNDYNEDVKKNLLNFIEKGMNKISRLLTQEHDNIALSIASLSKIAALKNIAQAIKLDIPSSILFSSIKNILSVYQNTFKDNKDMILDKTMRDIIRIYITDMCQQNTFKEIYTLAYENNKRVNQQAALQNNPYLESSFQALLLLKHCQERILQHFKINLQEIKEHEPIEAVLKNKLNEDTSLPEKDKDELREVLTFMEAELPSLTNTEQSLTM